MVQKIEENKINQQEKISCGIEDLPRVWIESKL
jgi:hypothetical protein